MTDFSMTNSRPDAYPKLLLVDSGRGNIPVKNAINQMEPSFDVGTIEDNAAVHGWGEKAPNVLASRIRKLLDLVQLKAEQAMPIFIASYTGSIALRTTGKEKMHEACLLDVTLALCEAQRSDLLIASTQATAESQYFRKNLSEEKRQIREVAMRGLARLIDNERTTSDQICSYLKDFRSDVALLNSPCIVLACSHYSNYSTCFEEVFNVPVIDPVQAFAEHIVSILKSSPHNLSTSRLSMQTTDQISIDAIIRASV